MINSRGVPPVLTSISTNAPILLWFHYAAVSPLLLKISRSISISCCTSFPVASFTQILFPLPLQIKHFLTAGRHCIPVKVLIHIHILLCSSQLYGKATALVVWNAEHFPTPMAKNGFRMLQGKGSQHNGQLTYQICQSAIFGIENRSEYE